MPYSTSNPPICMNAQLGHRDWVYKSEDPVTDVRVDGYITNAEDLGMQVNDSVKVIETDTNAVTLCTVVAINDDGSADLSDGTAVAATDTD